SVEQPLTPASVKPNKPTSTAIYVVARNAGEGADRSSGPGDYQLTATEKADITLIGKSYLHVVVVLNVGGVVDTSFYKAINKATKPSSPGSVINYPFGYGLSYTTFASTVTSVKANASKVTVKVTVTNTGKRSGKEVEQVYFSAPQSGLDKPYQELAGYAKTDELAPGASQTLTISYDTTQMSSFDVRNAAYLM